MKTIKYKTINGILKQCSQMTVEDFFSGMMYHKSKNKYLRFDLDDAERLKVAEKFAEYLLSSKKRRADLVDALMDGRGDLSYFQCFYVEYNDKHGLFFCCSLSGEAFEHCKRMYLKRYC